MTAPLPTIAIPTFDRNEVLVRTVFLLPPPLGPDVNSVSAGLGVDGKSPRYRCTECV